MAGEVRRMDFRESLDTGALRGELRKLMAELLPDDFLGAFTDDPNDFETTQRFCRELGTRQLIPLAWPAEYGGQERSPWDQMALREEMWAHHEPRGPQYMTVNWVAPALMRFGTDQQKQQHLPTIAAGDEVWCQGFSEPEAGSDLASLRTAAHPIDGGWEIHGQKVWTSYAMLAEWIFLLARTDSAAEKHHGITVFLIPLDRPGVEVRPIRAIVGPHHLNEVFLDGVWAGPEDVLGEVNDGWRVVRETLAFERVGIARYAALRTASVGGARGARRSLGGAAAGPPDQMGRRPRPHQTGQAPGLPGDRQADLGRGRPGRRGRLPDNGHEARPGGGRGADGCRTGICAWRSGRALSQVRGGGRRPLALRPGVDRGVRLG